MWQSIAINGSSQEVAQPDLARPEASAVALVVGRDAMRPASGLFSSLVTTLCVVTRLRTLRVLFGIADVKRPRNVTTESAVTREDAP
jgi:hypothetical protein